MLSPSFGGFLFIEVSADILKRTTIRIISYWKGLLDMEKAFTSQSINRVKQSFNKSINRLTPKMRVMHSKLADMLGDDNYSIGYTYKIAEKFSESEIYQVAEYCQRKANHPGKAFVAIFEKKLAGDV